MNNSPGARIARLIRQAWPDDETLCVETRERSNGLTDLSVISARFAGLCASDRESVLWNAIRNADSADLVRMTYGLLVTPDEWAEHQSVEEP